MLTASRVIAKGFHTELNDHSDDFLGSIDFLELDHCESLRRWPPAMSDLRQQEAAGSTPGADGRRSPGTGRYRGDLTNLPFDENPPHSLDQPTASRFRSPCSANAAP